ncbi:MAG: glycosyl hydrolase family 8 [Pseudomonadota bacterium]
MKRRLFIFSAPAALAISATGCGGGGDGGGSGNAAVPADTSASSIGASPAPAEVAVATPSPTAAQGAVAYPFGSRLKKYVAGISPTQSAEAMDATLTCHYDAWKAGAVVAADSVVPGGKVLKFSGNSYLVVSEGMGYGMLLAVLFAGHDPDARALFDSLLSVVRARPAYGITPYDANGKYLMDWRLKLDGTSGGDGWNALDGDLDIALALLMADRQWGSAGAWNYLQEARNSISAIKSWNMKADGATKGLPNSNNNRTSDYMVGHFRAFKKATGDAFWDLAVDRAYGLLDRMQTVYSPGVGLMPDFVIDTHTPTPAPSPGYIGDGNDKEGHYWWNACRNPWRLSSDFVLSGDPRFAVITARMIDFFRTASGGNPANIGSGYTLDGAKLSEWASPSFVGPICAGACVDPRFQTFLDATWKWNVANLETGYYDGELQLMSLAVASGNWWQP